MKIQFLIAMLGLAAAAHEGLSVHRRQQHYLKQGLPTIDVPVSSGMQVEIIVGSKN
jgi:hypothetical protein